MALAPAPVKTAWIAQADGSTSPIVALIGPPGPMGPSTEAAAQFAAQAGASALAAAGSASAAGASATAAAASEAGVAADAATASSAAAAANTKAGEASVSEAAAADSAAAALVSKNAAATSETNAAGSAATSTTKAGEASASAATATTKAGEASASAVTATSAAGTATAKADEATSQAVRAENAADAFEAMFHYVVADNLYDPATMRVAGKYVGAGGSISTDAAWAIIKVPVVAGQAYSWASNTTRREGSFWLSDINTPIAGTYDGTLGTAGVSQTRTAPAGATYLAMNIKSNTIAEPTQMMVNKGTTALAYSAYFTPYPLVKESKVYDDVPASVPSYVTNFTGKNLYNPAEKQADKFVGNAGGAVQVSTGWGCTGYMDVSAVADGASITISWGGTKRENLAFYDAAKTYVAGSVSTSTANPLTVTKPAGAKYLVVNLYSTSIAEPSWLQVEAGAAATEYEAWIGTEQRVQKAKITPDIVEPSAHLTLATLSLSTTGGDGGSYLSVPTAAGTLKHRFSPFRSKSHAASNLWNFYDVSLNGVMQTNGTSAGQSDDIAPFRVFGATIGAGHGYAATKCTVTGHGKTLVDVGSVWSGAGGNWIICDVPDANTIWVTAETGNGAFAGGALAHVSGATHAAGFTPSVVTAVQWYPPYKNRTLAISVDGKPVAAATAKFNPNRSVSFAESYDLMNKDSIVAWLKTQVGTATNIADYDGTADISVSVNYTYDVFGGCTIYTDFLALNAVAAFQDIMFAQAYMLGAVAGGVVKYLIPDTLAFTQGGVSYDFSKPFDMSGFAPSGGGINIDAAKIANAAVWPDRLVMLNSQSGFAIGYVPVRDADPAIRPSRASRKALEIRDTKKVYMSAIDSAARTSLAAGDQFGVIAYRVHFPVSAARTASYVVRTADADWLFADWHASKHDRLQLPADLHGRTFTVHRKSAGVTVRSQWATDSIVFDVATTGGAGQYAILRFPK